MLTVKTTRVPSWLLKGGVDLKPLQDTAVQRIATEIVTKHDRAKGLGAQVNKLSVETESLAVTVTTPLAAATTPVATNPRRTGAAFLRKNMGLFNGMAPRVAKKYILDPLRALWSQGKSV